MPPRRIKRRRRRLPPLSGDVADQHDAHITADTIHPAWYGDPLDLDYAAFVMTQ